MKRTKGELFITGVIIAMIPLSWYFMLDFIACLITTCCTIAIVLCYIDEFELLFRLIFPINLLENEEYHAWDKQNCCYTIVKMVRLEGGAYAIDIIDIEDYQYKNTLVIGALVDTEDYIRSHYIVTHKTELK